MRRALGVAAGVVTHAVFGVTVWLLFGFLKGDRVSAGEGTLGIDAVLALQFSVAHSVLLYPAVREALSRWIACPFYGLFYCMATCAGLLAVFCFWRTSPIICWELTGPARSLVTAAWFGAWASLMYSLWLNGLGYQTGWTPWWRWVCGRPPEPRPFRPRGAYLLLRHPVYLSFLGLVWFIPVMTADRAILTAVWTVYLFVGSWLKDRRMVHYLGEQYREYQTRVPGFPGIWFGPLGKLIRPEPGALSMVPIAVAQPTARPQEDVSSRQPGECELSPAGLSPVEVSCSRSR